MKILTLNFSLFPKITFTLFTNSVLEDIDGIRLEKTKLKEVCFANNQITSINKFPRFPYRLRYLSLDNNKLTNIDFLKSSDLRNLTQLILSHNKITSIQPLVDTNLKYLM